MLAHTPGTGDQLEVQSWSDASGARRSVPSCRAGLQGLHCALPGRERVGIRTRLHPTEPLVRPSDAHPALRRPLQSSSALSPGSAGHGPPSCHSSSRTCADAIFPSSFHSSALTVVERRENPSPLVLHGGRSLPTPLRDGDSRFAIELRCFRVVPVVGVAAEAPLALQLQLFPILRRPALEESGGSAEEPIGEQPGCDATDIRNGGRRDE